MDGLEYVASYTNLVNFKDREEEFAREANDKAVLAKFSEDADELQTQLESKTKLRNWLKND